jgi:prepilin-type processing-associated H-X9-DG protein
VAVVGSQTVWPGDRSVKLAELHSGTSNTVLLIETAAPAVTWTQPRDVTVSELFPADSNELGPQFAGRHGELANLAMCDGSVRFISYSVNFNLFRALCSCKGGEVVGEF